MSTLETQQALLDNIKATLAQRETAAPAREVQGEIQTAFENRALPLIARQIPVIWIPARTKKAIFDEWQDLASTDPVQIKQWGLENPDANVACVAKAQPGGIWILEIDKPNFHVDVIQKQTGQKMPETFTVRSSQGRGHFYFRQTAASIAMGNRQGKDENGKEAWSARVSDRYVIGPNSIHPSGSVYTILIDKEIADAPQWLIDWCAETKSAKTGHADPDDESPIVKGSRNNTLTSILGKARQVLAMDKEQLYEYRKSVNQKRCVPPLPESEVRAIANSIGGYAVKPSGPETVILGGVPGGKSSIAAPTQVPVNWRDSFKAVGELERGDVRMLIEGFLPEGTAFVGGLPGEGKTLFALSIARALTTGRPFLGAFNVPQIVPVIYLIPESGGRAFRRRCEKFEIPNDRNLFLCRTVSEGSTLPLDDQSLFEAIRRLKPVVILCKPQRSLQCESSSG